MFLFFTEQELDSLTIPVGGDQLTRVRLQGAKALRSGAHTKEQRLDYLYPVIIEMFHTIQDFLEVYIRITSPFSRTPIVKTYFVEHSNR